MEETCPRLRVEHSWREASITEKTSSQTGQGLKGPPPWTKVSNKGKRNERLTFRSGRYLAGVLVDRTARCPISMKSRVRVPTRGKQERSLQIVLVFLNVLNSSQPANQVVLSPK
ncbi:Hypothetical predicted protein [Pelobates cultripes]|uniref:Uncharacterized protein n=1 Tax=Pelobates cultripes TaxID=61616 RepID=A0AAD1SMZ1_PELCU|nr:Hypothetical predicted protein [Pelobates cultripes]